MEAGTSLMTNRDPETPGLRFPLPAIPADRAAGGMQTMFQPMASFLAGERLKPAPARRSPGKRGTPEGLPALLAVMVVLLICLMYAGDVLAQSTTPTVSSVAATSNPGTDNEYATGDTIGE